MEKKDRLIELRESAGMNRRQFAEYFEIPYRTVQDWELGNREMPEYLLRLIAYKLQMEKLVENGGDSDEQK
ncbi:MAG: helix-turn-helix domain-containing protein [Lachnospiraceae bacterium]|nr:helix-turn-helix domain-containing protein [Lachnospiraceae bacterium]